MKHEGKVVPVHAIETDRRRGVQLYSFLTPKLDGVRGQLDTPDALFPVKKPSTHFILGWVGPRASLYPSEKRKISKPLPDFENRILQPAA